MKILIVEDDFGKLEKIKNYVRGRIKLADIMAAQSYHGCLEAIESNVFDLILLDMSLPNFDISQNAEIGGGHQFGGKEILRHLKRRKILARVIVITAYETFDKGRVTLSQLKRELYCDYFPNYLDTIYFDTASLNWQVELKEHFKKISKELESKRRKK